MIVFVTIKFYFLISLYSIVFFTLLGSILTNAAFGQTSSTSSPSIGLQQSTFPKLHLVKITSPTKGEQVPVGKDLVISGTSVDNGTSGCKVSVKVDFINPYHDALPLAQGVQNNSYSKWSFTLTPAYTIIQPGENKIIAKFSCAENPSLISKTTVNVTGIRTIPIVATANTSKENNDTQQQVSSIPTPPQPALDTASPLASIPADNNNATATADLVHSDTTSSTTVGKGNTDPQTLSVSVHFGKNSIHPGDTQTIMVKVSDKNSANTISGASVTGQITGPSSGLLKKLEGTTDNKGEATYSWKTSNDYPSGKYELKVEASYQGYSDYSTSKTFKVIPLPVTGTGTGTSSYKVIPYYHSNIISIPYYRSYQYSTDTNTNSDTNTNHHHHSKIIRSYPYSTDTNTNSDTNTNHHHHSKIISSYPYSTDTNTNSYHPYHYRYHSHNDISSNDHTGTTTGDSGLNLGIGNLAQKIINDVRSKLDLNGIRFP